MPIHQNWTKPKPPSHPETEPTNCTFTFTEPLFFFTAKLGPGVQLKFFDLLLVHSCLISLQHTAVNCCITGAHRNGCSDEIEQDSSIYILVIWPDLNSRPSFVIILLRSWGIYLNIAWISNTTASIGTKSFFCLSILCFTPYNLNLSRLAAVWVKELKLCFLATVESPITSSSETKPFKVVVWSFIRSSMWCRV